MSILKFESDIENIKFNVAIHSDALETNANLSAETHYHTYYEIHYVKSGEILFEFENSSELIKENTLVIIAPNQFHSVKYISENNDCISFLFWLSKLNEGEDLYLRYFTLLNKIKDYILIRYEDTAFISLKKDIPDLCSINDKCITKATLTLLFFKLTQLITDAFKIKTAPKKAHPPRKPQLSEIINIEILVFISKHYNETVTVIDLAKELYLSPRHIERIIKKHFSKTFTDLLNEQRIAVAKNILKHDSNIPLEDVGRSVGYESYSSFWKYFKKISGCSPATYKQQVQTKTFSKQTKKI